MSPALFICIEKRTKIHSGNPYNTDGRVWTRGGASVQPGGARGGAVRPSRPMAKSATVSSTFFPLQSGPSTRSYNNKSDNNCNYIFCDTFIYNFYNYARSDAFGANRFVVVYFM